MRILTCSFVTSLTVTVDWTGRLDGVCPLVCATMTAETGAAWTSRWRRYVTGQGQSDVRLSTRHAHMDDLYFVATLFFTSLFISIKPQKVAYQPLGLSLES